MDQNQFLNSVIPHRLRGNAILFASTQIYAKCLVYENELPARLSVKGEVVMEGGVFSLLNPLVEAGLVNLRCLVQFLGVKRNSKSGILVARIKRSDDVGIEDFKFNGMPLSKVTPETLCSILEDYPPDAAYEAMCHTLQMADKAIAHVTANHNVICTDLRQVAVAAKCVESAVMRFLYRAMELEQPNIKVKSVE